MKRRKITFGSAARKINRNVCLKRVKWEKLSMLVNYDTFRIVSVADLKVLTLDPDPTCHVITDPDPIC